MRYHSTLAGLSLIVVSPSMVCADEKPFFSETVYSFIRTKIVANFKPIGVADILDNVTVNGVTISELSIKYFDSKVSVESNEDLAVLSSSVFRNCTSDNYVDKVTITTEESYSSERKSLESFQSRLTKSSSVQVSGDVGFKAGGSGGWNASVSADFKNTIESEITSKREMQSAETANLSRKTERVKDVVIPPHTVRAFEQLNTNKIYQVPVEYKIIVDATGFLALSDRAGPAMGVRFNYDRNPPFRLSDIFPNPNDRILEFQDTINYTASGGSDIRIRDLDYEKNCK